jgi:hypothetical protein
LIFAAGLAVAASDMQKQGFDGDIAECFYCGSRTFVQQHPDSKYNPENMKAVAFSAGEKVEISSRDSQDKPDEL